MINSVKYECNIPLLINNKSKKYINEITIVIVNKEIIPIILFFITNKGFVIIYIKYKNIPKTKDIKKESNCIFKFKI